MLLLCELLLLVGFVAMNNFFLKKCSLHWFFLIEWLSSEPILSTLVYITEQNFFEKSSTKFKLESFDSASMSRTIIPYNLLWSKRCLCCGSGFCCWILWSWLTILLTALFLDFVCRVVSFLANTVKSILHNRWKKNVKKVFPLLELKTSVSGFTVLIFWS